MRFKYISTCLLILVGITFSACASSDCPLNNTVNMVVNFYNSQTGYKENINETMSIYVSGKRDTLLINRIKNFNTLKLPLSYTGATDTLLMRFLTEDGFVTDTLYLSHTNQPHFVSLECSTAYFHTLTDTKSSHRQPSADFPTAIDSIVIANPSINYDEKENLKIYFSHY